MTTDALEGRSMRTRIAELRAAVAARPDIDLGANGLPVPGSETNRGESSGVRDDTATADAPTGGIIRPSSATRRRL